MTIKVPEKERIFFFLLTRHRHDLARHAAAAPCASPLPAAARPRNP
jgi:hypothetical protein